MALMSWIRCLALISATLFVTITAKQVYIVHMDHDSKPDSFTTHHDWYASIIQSITSTPSHHSHIYTYTTAFHGFAAHLDPHEVDSLRELDGVFDVHEDRLYMAHTTRTPEFLGIDNYPVNTPNKFVELDEQSHNLIIGVIDSGIWPESKSFDDSGMPDIPKGWRGKCESAFDFNPKIHCNKKLIGARAVLKTYQKLTGVNKTLTSSPRDIDGHGTHTAGTAAGAPVANASLFGYAAGVARGMATRARLATYRVCWNRTACSQADILQGMIKAIEDGVNVLSISLGAVEKLEYYDDPIAKASFTAMQLGVIVSCSAGNSATTLIENVAPWILTVGAGSLDRQFPGYVLLGNNITHAGFSLSSNQGKFKGNSKVQLLYLKGSENSSTNLCLPGLLERTKIQGKIVVCDIDINGTIQPVQQGLAVREAGGVGMILANTDSLRVVQVDESSHVLPAVTVLQTVGDLIREYALSDSNATATLSFGRTDLKVKPTPMVAWFSSRGPNTITPQILKPDLIGPGVQILAAWPDAIPVTGLKEDTRRTPFNIVSGTSMACPHISGIATLLKVAHPNWSPSAIKSALMTTAYTMDNTNSPILDNLTGAYATPLAYGSGYVNPQKAISPGLVYDISRQEYIMFLCSLNYTLKQVRSLAQNRNINCSRKFSDPGQLNYPSFSIILGQEKRVVRYTRKLTNVGAAGSVYDVVVVAPPSVEVTVRPTRLLFKNEGDRQRYTVTFVLKKHARPSSDDLSSGSIVWRNKEHQVRSPIMFTWL